MALESQVSPSNTTLRPLMGGTTSDLTGTCSPPGSCTSACGPSRMALCTASCNALPAVLILAWANGSFRSALNL